MFSTVEVRWFQQGRVPPEVETWFEQNGVDLGQAASRTDYYLRLAGDDGLGIKVREGRMEVKQRQAPTKLLCLHPRVAGWQEHWRKWSIGLALDGPGLVDLLAPPASWVGVEKARFLRRYRVTGAGTVLTVPITEYPDRACDWELTRVRVEGSTWWTVGFEAFGLVPYLEQTLHTVIAQVMAAGAPPALKAPDSLGYPQWLARRELGQA